MNILITSVGRRAYIVKYFKNALGENGLVHVSNSNDTSIAFKYADKSVVSPLIYDNNYIPFLLDYCKNNQIGLLISLFDADLPVLARNKKRFEAIGVNVIVSSEEIVDVCNDKWQTYLFLKENSFSAPKTYLDKELLKKDIKNGTISYPIIVKPRFGCGSISITIAENEAELDFYSQKVEKQLMDTYLRFESSTVEQKVVFQEFLKGQEYGADIMNDLDGNLAGIAIRKKIAMRSGETDVAEMVEEPTIERELKRLSGVTKHIGNMDCDIFLLNDKPYILEMNARFGGGYPFSHLAGCNLPMAIIKWSDGKAVDKTILKPKKGIRGFKELEVVEW